MKPTDLVTLAADTSAFYRALLADGLNDHVATTLTSTYLQSRIIAERATEEPKPPWEPGT